MCFPLFLWNFEGSNVWKVGLLLFFLCDFVAVLVRQNPLARRLEGMLLYVVILGSKKNRKVVPKSGELAFDQHDELMA